MEKRALPKAAIPATTRDKPPVPVKPAVDRPAAKAGSKASGPAIGAKHAPKK